MYLSVDAVLEATKRLSKFHPFYGITFLVCKQQDLPVGNLVSFPINALEEDLLRRFYKPDLRSRYFFQPFHTSSRLGSWLSPKYPSSGSQSTRTRGEFAGAFVHERNTDLWAWSQQYLDVLRAKLIRDSKANLPVFWLAVWLYRDRHWDKADVGGLISKFVSEFHITKREISALFDTSVTNEIEGLFSETHFSDEAFLSHVEPPPDAPPEDGGTLRWLSLKGIGPARTLEIEPGERLSVITGDNGLGKTFLMEVAWWALTGNWAERPALPRTDVEIDPPTIGFEVATRSRTTKKRSIQYDYRAQDWVLPKTRTALAGLVVYARVDGSFAIWDPVRQGRPGEANHKPVFSREQVLNGLPGKIEGLIRDWIRWQFSTDSSVFLTFQRVLKRLSPPDMSPLVPGAPTRIPNDV